MVLKVNVVDGQGKGHALKINGEGEIPVSVHTHPPADEETASIPFQSYFLSNGSNDMRVNGATSNVDFEINAIAEFDVYIKTLSVAIVDAGAKLNSFGSLSALTNGVQLIWRTQDLGESIINEGIKTNFDFMRQSMGQPAFGNSTTAFIASNVLGNSEGIFPAIDFTKLFGVPWGLRLRKDSEDRLFFRIRDNLSVGIDQFDVIGYGIKLKH